MYFVFSYTFYNQLVNFYQKVYWDFDWDWVKLKINLGRVGNLTILKFLFMNMVSLSIYLDLFWFLCFVIFLVHLLLNLFRSILCFDSIANVLFLFFIYLFNLFFLTSLLEYSCFTMVCEFLLYNKVSQLYVYIYPHISSLLRLPPSHPPNPTPLGGYRALSCFPLAICFTFGSIY